MSKRPRISWENDENEVTHPQRCNNSSSRTRSTRSSSSSNTSNRSESSIPGTINCSIDCNNLADESPLCHHNNSTFDWDSLHQREMSHVAAFLERNKPLENQILVYRACTKVQAVQISGGHPLVAAKPHAHMSVHDTTNRGQ